MDLFSIIGIFNIIILIITSAYVYLLDEYLELNYPERYKEIHTLEYFEYHPNDRNLYRLYKYVYNDQEIEDDYILRTKKKLRILMIIMPIGLFSSLLVFALFV